MSRVTLTGTVVGADPDHAALEARFDHRVNRRVDLFAGDVPRDRIARDDLILRFLGGQIGADDVPRNAFVRRAMEHVRGLVDDALVMRRHVDDRLAREAVLDLVRIVAVAVLRIHPVVLLLPGVDVVAADLALARAPHHLAVLLRPDLAGLAS